MGLPEAQPLVASLEQYVYEVRQHSPVFRHMPRHVHKQTSEHDTVRQYSPVPDPDPDVTHTHAEVCQHGTAALWQYPQAHTHGEELQVGLE